MKRFWRPFDYREIVLVGAIVVASLLLRVWGLNFDLPYLTHPDEPNKIEMAQQMFKTGDLNPHYFWKPSLFIYLNALLYVPYYVLGRSMGVFAVRDDIPAPIMITGGNGWTAMPTTVLMGRSLTVVAALLCVVLVYLIGRRAFGRKPAGYLAAVLLALSPTHVYNSRFITVNIFLVAAILVVTWFSVLVYEKGRTRDYLLAGLATGIAISFKYPGALVASSVVAAHVLREGRQGFRDWRLYVAMACIPAGFLIGTPFALLDYQKFIQDVLYELRHYSTGHAGMEGNALAYYVSYAWQVEGLFVLAACLEMLRGLIRRDKVSILLSVFPIIYFLFISSFAVRNDRTFLPLVPFVALFAASITVHLFGTVSRLQGKSLRLLSAAGLTAVVVFGIGYSANRTLAGTRWLTTADGRDSSRVWIENNLPPGSAITVESYTPFVSPTDYAVMGVTKMIDHPPEWYGDQGIEYLVFGQGMFGRYYDEPARYAEEVALYDRFFAEMPLVASFDEGGYEVQIREVAQLSSPVSD